MRITRLLALVSICKDDSGLLYSIYIKQMANNISESQNCNKVVFLEITYNKSITL